LVLVEEVPGDTLVQAVTVEAVVPLRPVRLDQEAAAAVAAMVCLNLTAAAVVEVLDC
jgi:hypothetical protein